MPTLPDRWLLVLLAWTGLHVLFVSLALFVWATNNLWLWLGLGLVVTVIFLGAALLLVIRGGDY